MARKRRVDPFGLPQFDTIPQLDPLAQLQQMQEPDPESDEGYGRHNQDSGGGPALTPEEERSMLGKIAGGAEWIGDTIEKPGYAVRGVMQGQPEALLNLIPFYDTVQQSGIGESLGLPEAPKVRGEDITGWKSDENDEWYDKVGKFVGNTGVELATNPLTFASFLPKLGVTATAKAAKIAGEAGQGISEAEKIAAAVKGLGIGAKPLTQTPTVIADQLRAGERAVMGFGLPFMEPAITLGKGSERAAKAIEAIGYSRPVAAMRGLFSHVPNVGGTYNPQLQHEADRAWAMAEGNLGAIIDAKPVFDEGLRSFEGAFSEAAEALGKQGDEEAMKAFRDLPRILKAEKDGVPDIGEIATRMGELLGVARGQELPEALQTLAQSGEHFQAMFEGMQKFEGTLHEMAVKFGVPIGTWAKAYEGYTPRVASDSILQARAKRQGVPVSSLKGGGYNPATHRRPWLDLFPQSTKYANEAARDSVLRGYKALEPLAEGEAAIVSGKVSVGSVVHAADRQNYGRVIDVGQGKARVHFVSPDGVEATVTLPIDSITQVSSGAADIPAQLLNSRAFVSMKAADHATALRDSLTSRGITVHEDATRPQLQALYVKHVYVKPALKDAVDRGLMSQAEADAELAKLTGVKAVETTGPAVSTVARPPLPSEAANNLGAIPQDAETLATLGRATSGKLSRTGIDKIVRGLNRLPKETLNTGVWDKDVVKEWFTHVNSVVEKIYNARTVHNFMQQPGVLQKAGEATRDGIPLLQAWKRTGMTEKGIQNLLKVPDVMDDAGTVDAAATAKAIAKAANGYQVTNDGVRLIDTMRDLQRPETIGPLGKAWDEVHRYIKSYLTVPRFSFHARNEISGFYQNVADGMASPLLIAKKYAAAHAQAMTGKEHLTFFGEFKSLGGLSDGIMKDIDAFREVATDQPRGLFGGAADTLLKGITHPVETWKSGGYNPLAIGGKEGAKQNIFLAAGNKMYSLVEYVNRASYYDALRESGFKPSEALHYVERAQFNYSKKSPFERRILSRILPFYGWVRNNLPLQLTRIIERPLGGVTGVALKTTKDLSSGDSEFTPDFLREGLGINLGGPANATSFLKQAGLPFEDLNKFVFKDGVPNAMRTTEKLASQVSPLLLAPIEQVAGKQLFSGRNLKDIQGYTGIPTVDSLIHYSPASALVGEAMSMADDRKEPWQKLLNAVTGMKVGTYDADIMKIRALRNAQQEALANNPMVGEGSYYYQKPQTKGQPGTDDIRKQMRVLSKLQKASQTLQKATKRREAEKLKS